MYVYILQTEHFYHLHVTKQIPSFEFNGLHCLLKQFLIV